MIALKTFLQEKKIHLVFELSLWFKAIFAVSEIVAGAATWFVPQQLFLTLVLWVTRDEFAEDPHDLVANFLLRTVQHLSVDTQKFAAIYLLGHGVVKLWLIIGLLRERLWYFPVSIIVFGLFIAYQIYRYTFTHSVSLLLITALDIVIIALTWHEYRYLRNERQMATNA
ncbi:DUF2127 domain-containing protein [Burkholderia cenocepacia]|uniref:DUF2127 domain-containing protein n=1 Tax=Burkholderia cepacia complex TaxID=87882 RepID=UPI001590B1AA|nr:MULTISPECIES: DUF2127 domain-containing protein [Burkholderia cepacia complex]MCW3663683.1 DUF2127 domain-containing protein [Burkholderia cenocepacia]